MHWHDEPPEQPCRATEDGDPCWCEGCQEAAEADVPKGAAHIGTFGDDCGQYGPFCSWIEDRWGACVGDDDVVADIEALVDAWESEGRLHHDGYGNFYWCDQALHKQWGVQGSPAVS